MYRKQFIFKYIDKLLVSNTVYCLDIILRVVSAVAIKHNLINRKTLYNDLIST